MKGKDVVSKFNTQCLSVVCKKTIDNGKAAVLVIIESKDVPKDLLKDFGWKVTTGPAGLTCDWVCFGDHKDLGTTRIMNWTKKEF